MILAILVYVFFEKARNLHRRMLMCYVTCLGLFYFTMGFVQLDAEKMQENKTLCETFSYASYYFIIACFFWLLMMCLDICQKVKYIKMSPELINDVIIRTTIEAEEKKSFWKYFCFSFGVSALITSLLYSIDTLTEMKSDQCSRLLVKMSDSDFPFVYIPIVLMITHCAYFYARTGLEIFKLREDRHDVVDSIDFMNVLNKFASPFENIEVEKDLQFGIEKSR